MEERNSFNRGSRTNLALSSSEPATHHAQIQKKGSNFRVKLCFSLTQARLLGRKLTHPHTHIPKKKRQKNLEERTTSSKSNARRSSILYWNQHDWNTTCNTAQLLPPEKGPRVHLRVWGATSTSRDCKPARWCRTCLAWCIAMLASTQGSHSLKSGSAPYSPAFGRAANSIAIRASSASSSRQLSRRRNPRSTLDLRTNS